MVTPIDSQKLEEILNRLPIVESENVKRLGVFYDTNFFIIKYKVLDNALKDEIFDFLNDEILKDFPDYKLKLLSNAKNSDILEILYERK